MNGRSGLLTFFLFLFLAVMIVLQILAMVQSDRLYERLNMLLDRVASGSMWRTSQQEQPKAAALPMQEYPGDEGDALVRHLAGEPRTLNPITEEASLGTRWIISGNILEPLFKYDEDFDGIKFKPWLAKSYGTSDDGMEITVKLRDDIWFSDGVRVTADDVLFTFNMIMDPNIDTPSLRSYYNNIKGVSKIDDRTVKFSFNEIYWKTLEVALNFDVFPKHIYDYNDAAEFNTNRDKAVGSGPYVLDKWDVGQRIVLRRNEHYWGHKPKIQKLIYRFITNTTAALQAVRSGEVDYMEPTSEQYVEMSENEQFKEEYNILSFWEPSGGFSFIGWNENTPYFKDKRVRLAMTHIMNRASILKHVLRGYGTIVTGPFYVHGKQSDPDVKPWPYDLERAKELLDEAGWVDSDGDGIRDKDRVRFRFKFSYNPGGSSSERLVRVLVESGSKVGVEVLPDPLEWSIFSERLNNRKFEAAILMWGGTIESDPYQIFHSSQMQGRGNNFVGFNNAEADSIIEEARRTLDPEKRYVLYHRFHRLLHEEQPYTVLFSRPEPRFLHKRFENVIVHKLGLNEHEWYVPLVKQKYR